MTAIHWHDGLEVVAETLGPGLGASAKLPWPRAGLRVGPAGSGAGLIVAIELLGRALYTEEDQELAIEAPGFTPARGFAWLACEGCAFHRFIPFSSKGRGFCPLCAGRRMAEGSPPWAELFPLFGCVNLC